MKQPEWSDGLPPDLAQYSDVIFDKGWQEPPTTPVGVWGDDVDVKQLYKEASKSAPGVFFIGNIDPIPSDSKVIHPRAYSPDEAQEGAACFLSIKPTMMPRNFSLSNVTIVQERDKSDERRNKLTLLLNDAKQTLKFLEQLLGKTSTAESVAALNQLKDILIEWCDYLQAQLKEANAKGYPCYRWDEYKQAAELLERITDLYINNDIVRGGGVEPLINAIKEEVAHYEYALWRDEVVEIPMGEAAKQIRMGICRFPAIKPMQAHGGELAALQETLNRPFVLLYGEKHAHAAFSVTFMPRFPARIFPSPLCALIALIFSPWMLIGITRVGFFLIKMAPRIPMETFIDTAQKVAKRAQEQALVYATSMGDILTEEQEQQLAQLVGTTVVDDLLNNAAVKEIAILPTELGVLEAEQPTTLIIQPLSIGALAVWRGFQMDKVTIVPDIELLQKYGKELITITCEKDGKTYTLVGGDKEPPALIHTHTTVELPEEPIPPRRVVPLEEPPILLREPPSDTTPPSGGAPKPDGAMYTPLRGVPLQPYIPLWLKDWWKKRHRISLAPDGGARITLRLHVRAIVGSGGGWLAHVSPLAPRKKVKFKIKHSVTKEQLPPNVKKKVKKLRAKAKTSHHPSHSNVKVTPPDLQQVLPNKPLETYVEVTTSKEAPTPVMTNVEVYTPIVRGFRSAVVVPVYNMTITSSRLPMQLQSIPLIPYSLVPTSVRQIQHLPAQEQLPQGGAVGTAVMDDIEILTGGENVTLEAPDGTTMTGFAPEVATLVFPRREGMPTPAVVRATAGENIVAFRSFTTALGTVKMPVRWRSADGLPIAVALYDHLALCGAPIDNIYFHKEWLETEGRRRLPVSTMGTPPLFPTEAGQPLMKPVERYMKACADTPLIADTLPSEAKKRFFTRPFKLHSTPKPPTDIFIVSERAIREAFVTVFAVTDMISSSEVMQSALRRLAGAYSSWEEIRVLPATLLDIRADREDYVASVAVCGRYNYLYDDTPSASYVSAKTTPIHRMHHEKADCLDTYEDVNRRVCTLYAERVLDRIPHIARVRSVLPPGVSAYVPPNSIARIVILHADGVRYEQCDGVVSQATASYGRECIIEAKVALLRSNMTAGFLTTAYGIRERRTSKQQ